MWYAIDDGSDTSSIYFLLPLDYFGQGDMMHQNNVTNPTNKTITVRTEYCPSL